MSLLLCVSLLLAAPETVVQGRSATGPASFSPDGKQLLTVAPGGAILWDVATGEEIRTLRGHTEDVMSARIGLDGKQAVTASRDNTVRIWDLLTGGCTRMIKVERPNDASLSLDGKSLAVGRGDGWVVFDLSGPEPLASRFGGDETTHVFFSANGARLASASQSEVRVLGWKDGKSDGQSWGLGGSRGTMSSDGAHLASYGSEGILVAELGPFRKRTLREHKPAGAGLGSPQKPWDHLTLSADGGTLALTGRSNVFPHTELLLLDTSTGAEKLHLESPLTLLVPAAFSPDGRFIYFGGELLDAATGKTVRRFLGRAQRTFGAGFSADGTRLTTLQVNSAPPGHAVDDVVVLRTWDLATLRPIATASERRELDSNRLPAFTADGRHVLVPSLPAGTMDLEYRQRPPDRDSGRLWDLDTGKVVRGFPAISFSNGASFSRDGRLFATEKFFNPHLTVKLFDAQTGKEVKSFTDKFYANCGEAIALSPDGKLVAYGAKDAALGLWEPATGRKRILESPTDDSVRQAANVALFSPDGTVLAVVRGNQILLIDPKEATELRRMTSNGRDGLFDSINSLAFSPDGRRLASGGTDATVRIWEVASGAPLSTLTGHTGPMRGIAFSPNGKLLATTGDQTTRLWNAETGELLVSLVSTGEADYAALAPDGHYLASRGAGRDLHFSKGFSIIPFQSVDLVLHRPDLVIARVGLAQQTRVDSLKRAWLKRLQLMGFTEEQVSGDLHLPELALVREPPLESAERKLTLSVHAFDSEFKLDRINIAVNDIPAFGAKGLSLREPARKEANREVELELSEGLNRIDLSVLNERGAESLRRAVVVNYVGPRRDHALTVVAVGVSNYGRPDFNLTYAAKDARDLATQFEQLGKKGFARVEKVELLDGDATKEKLLALREKLAATQVDDEVVLFVAGHGLLDDNLDYYFGTADIDFDKPALRGLPYDQLEGLLDGIPARRKLLLMDTCFSGEVDKSGVEVAANTRTSDGLVKTRAVGTRGLKRKNTLPLDESLDAVRELFADLRRSSGAVVISSAGGAEFALESSEWKNGVFTYALVSGLRSRAADLDKDGVIRVSELREYAAKKVTQLTQGKQKPTARRENLEWDFALE